MHGVKLILVCCRMAGLHPLAPYLTQLIAAETAARLGSLPHLALLLGTAEALLQNPGVDMEPYVHQLLPAVVTCLVARRLGVRRQCSAATPSCSFPWSRSWSATARLTASVRLSWLQCHQA